MHKIFVSLFMIVFAIALPVSADSMEPYTLDDAAQLYTARILSMEDIAKVSRHDKENILIEAASGVQLTANLSNLLLAMNEQPEFADKIIDEFVAAMVETIAALELPADTSEQIDNLMPLIRHKSIFDNSIETMLANAPDALDDQAFYIRPLAGDYAIVLAIDTPTSISYANNKSFADLNLSDDALYKRAVSNLKARLPNKLETAKQENVTFVGLDGFYDASLLLIDDFWKNHAEEMQGDLVMVAPARDMVMFVDSADKTALKIMTEYARNNIEALPHPISDVPLKWTKNGWKRF